MVDKVGDKGRQQREYGRGCGNVWTRSFITRYRPGGPGRHQAPFDVIHTAECYQPSEAECSHQEKARRTRSDHLDIDIALDVIQKY